MNKERIKRLIYNSEIRIVTIITDGLGNRAGKRKIMNQVRAEINRMNILSDVERNHLWLWAVRYYKRAIVSDPKDRVPVVVKELEHTKNDIANSYENRKKHEELMSLLQSDTKFYYCTVLSDPAPDHAAYQGKIYYNDNASFTDAEKDYINKYNLISVREVTMESPWLCTRPNCRHRLIPLDKNHKLIKQKNMSYEYIQYRNYYDRYKLLKAIGADTKDTEFLMRKWYDRAKNKE